MQELFTTIPKHFFTYKPTSFLLIFLSLLQITFSCQHDSNLPLDYCLMLANDQRTSMAANDKNLVHKPSEVFESNFKLIIDKTISEGFPPLSKNREERDSCKYWAITATFIHTAKSAPSTFYSKKVVDLLAVELDQKRLDKEILIVALNISFQTITYCESIRKNMAYALDKWSINTNMLNNANFKQCE